MCRVTIQDGVVAIACTCDPDAAAVRLAEAESGAHEAAMEHDAAADLAMTRDLEIDLRFEREAAGRERTVTNGNG